MAFGSDTANAFYVAKPAVIASWAKTASQIDAALRAGGESGMDLLLNVVPEWGEAVEQANLALDACWNLADQGLRSEALDWHAAGFLETARRLHPERPGWEAWEQALLARDVDIPRIDLDTLELVEGLQQELDLQDISGVSLNEHLAALRKNVLVRGHLGERLMILEALQALDPAKPIWADMVVPIMKLRARSFGADLEDAITKRDFRRIQLLATEAKSPQLSAALPGPVGVTLRSARHWAAAPSELAEFKRATALCTEQNTRLKQLRVGAVDHASAVEACGQALSAWEKRRTVMSKVLREVSEVPRLQEDLQQLGIEESINKAERLIREAEQTVRERKQWEKLRNKFSKIEDLCDRLRRSAPDRSMGWESFKTKARAWLIEADEALGNARSLCSQVADAVPESTETVTEQLATARQNVKQSLERTKKTEILLVGSVVAVIVGGSLLFIGILVVRAVLQ
jgi:hypothetical protein